MAGIRKKSPERKTAIREFAERFYFDNQRSPSMTEIATELKISRSTAYEYGLAILANTDHLNLTEAELREAFRREFRALIAIYGKPTRLPDFAVQAGVVL